MDFFDTHTHYDWEEFKEDRELLFKKLKDILIVNIGCSIYSCKESINYTKNYNNFFCSLGIHPMNVENNESLEELENLITDKTVAIGETGLDYKFPNIDLQRKYFLKHIELANKYELPIIIHCRKAHSELYNIIINNQLKKSAIMHCYSGDLEYAKKFLELGFYFGFDGPITRDDKYDEIIKLIPLDHILVETDAPLMPPFPLQENDRCDSLSLKFIISKIARVKELEYDLVKNTIFKNSLKAFNIKISD